MRERPRIYRGLLRPFDPLMVGKMEPLKNRYNEAYIAKLVEVFTRLMPTFPGEEFSRSIFDEHWEKRELKDRMYHISMCLADVLPAAYIEALSIMKQAAPEFGGFEAMFFPDFVARYGLEEWEHSLPALAHFTRFSSSEFAVRPFIAADADRMMRQMLVWARDDNEHVRRLASEGCRPRLPWAMALPAFKKDPEPILPILELLRDDPSDYVRRSVANNLNDVAKDHPDLVLSLAEHWYGLSTRCDRMLKHACRTLLKAGNGKAMALFGFSAPRGVTVSRLSAEDVQIGKTLLFECELVCDEDVFLRLEYAIHYVKANGSRSRKVFKISERTYLAGKHKLQRRQGFKDLTTRQHHPGEHRLDIMVNGLKLAETRFSVSR